MRRLEEFGRIAYDTNCLVYYCFEVHLPDSNPTRTVRAELTAHTKALTESLKSKGKQITTIQAAYRELNDCINTAVVCELEKPSAKAMLGIASDQPVRDQLKMHIQKSVQRHVTKLQAKTWFVVDREFKASPASFQTLREFFDSIPPEELKDSERASAVDIELVNFGAVHQIPLVTNDGGVYRFTNKLKTAGLAFRIHGLRELSL